MKSHFLLLVQEFRSGSYGMGETAVFTSSPCNLQELNAKGDDIKFLCK